MAECRCTSSALDRISSILLAVAMAVLGEWVLFGAFLFEVVLSSMVSRVEVEAPDEGASASLVRRILRHTFAHLCEEKLLGLFRIGLLALAVVQIALHLGFINVPVQMAACALVVLYIAIRYFSFVRINYRLLGRRLFETRHGSTVLPKG